MSKSNSSETSVKERRLRPVYDLLDGCNNKRAVQEVDRLLKKQPNFTCAKVLKALALLRMNKPQECLAIIKPITEDNPIEDSTLQALSICYRELEQPEMVCQLYENACKIEHTEDMLTHCFLAYVRVADFPNQYQAAMKLYKMFKKGPYFCWAIMSLVAQAVHSPSSSAARVSLPLAERMMSKFMEESKPDTEKELTLYILILQKQRDYAKLIDVLENTVKPTVSAVTGLYHQLKIECLQETHQYQVLAQYLESSILGRPNEWQYYSEYISLLEAIGESRVDSFLRKVLDLYRSEVPPKSTLLAFFLLYDTLAKKGRPSRDDGFDLIDTYLKHYGHKASCFMDIAPFLRALPLNKFSNVIPSPSNSFTPGSFTVHHLRRQTNHLQLTRFLMTDENKNILVHLDSCQYLVQACTNVREVLSQQQLAECSALAELIKLAALHVIDSFWSNISACKGLYQMLQAKHSSTDILKHIRMPSSSNASTSSTSGACRMKQNDSSVPNGLVHTSVKYLIEEEDFPVLLCCSLLTYAFEESSYSQINLLLTKLYIRCGAVGAAVETIQKLDLKYIQFESVGYIYLWKMIPLGLLSEGFRILKAAETFYGVYQKESIEHILSAYKYGAWARVLEFTEFRKRLLNSVQSYLIKFENKLLEYCRDGSSHSQTLQIRQNGSYDIDTVPWDDLTDGRDLNAVKDFTPTHNVQQWKDVTFRADKYRLKIRGLLLMLMNDAVALMQEDNDVQKGVANMMKNMKLLKKEMDTDLRQYEVDEQIPIDGMWPPRIAQYLRSGYLEALLDYFLLLCNLIDDSPIACIEGTAKRLENFCNLTLVTAIRTADQKTRTLFEMSDFLQDFYDVLETLSFMCILTDVLSYILNKELSLKEKSKKKKGKSVGVHAMQYQMFVCLMKSMNNCYYELHEKVGRQVPRLHSEYTFSASVPDISGFCEPTIGSTLTHIVETSLPTVLNKLHGSYLKSLDDIINNIKAKVKYLKSLHIRVDNWTFHG